MSGTAVTSSFADVLKLAAAGRCRTEMLAIGLQALGTKGEARHDELDPERRAALVSLFVRNLKGLPVAAALELERELLQQTDALPSVHRSMTLRDSLGLIALRNHVRYLTVALGFDWSTGMMVQSSIAELARILLETGSAELGFSLGNDGRQADVKVQPALVLPVEGFLLGWRPTLPDGLEASAVTNGAFSLHLAARSNSH
jgi:hypothetical protein